MEAIIVFVVSAVGAFFYNIDFCTLYTFVDIAFALCRIWADYTNDKAAEG